MVTSSYKEIVCKRAVRWHSPELLGPFREVPNVSQGQCQETKSVPSTANVLLDYSSTTLKS